jgi:hypothetical protein
MDGDESALPDRFSGPPIGLKNWRAIDGGAAAGAWGEWVLYSDARIVGELRGLGPYELLNLVPSQDRRPGHALPAIALRMDWVNEFDIDPLFTATKAITESHHGGWIDDEIAALVSLALVV